MQFAGKRADVAAILILVRIDPLGVTGWLQFDTGVNVSTLYAGTLQRVGHATSTPAAAIHITAAGFDATVTPQLYANLDEGDLLGRPVLGTLGIDAMRGRALAIDFPHRRLAVAAARALLPPDAQPQTQVPMRIVTRSGNDAELEVPVRLQTDVAAKVSYDTGSSPFVLILSNAMWRRVTGRALDDRRNLSLHTPSWGEKTSFIGAPARGTVAVGNPLARDPIVFTGGDAATDARFANGNDGTLGSALFVVSYVVILDFRAGRFGLRNVAAPGKGTRHGR